MNDQNKSREILKKLGLYDEVSKWFLGIPRDKSERISLPSGLTIFKYKLNEIIIYFLPDRNILFKIESSLINEGVDKEDMLNVNNNYFMLFKLE